MQTDADITLIASCQQGDARAFREVFDHYKDRIFALCRHMAGNREDAEDLTQEAFVSAFKNISSFRAESSFGTWLYRIATNHCLSKLRRQTPRTHSFEDLSERDAAPPAGGPSPEEMVVRKELSRRMEAAIADLPENLRVIFVLGTLEGMRYKEIAEIAACSEEAVKMRIHRARKRIRSQIPPAEPEA